MFNVVYRWEVREGKEALFEQTWAQVTELIRSHRGGLGSRLHRCEDGTWVAYAQWPDKKTWELSSKIPLPENSAMAEMQSCIETSEPPLLMTLVQDLFD